MPTNQTQNYHLSQWEPGDKVDHRDFNADNLAIDKAIKAVDVRADELAADKADVSALNSLQSAVDGKASTTALNNLQSTVSSLQSSLNSLKTTVDKKQDASGAVKFEAGSYTGNTAVNSGGATDGSQTIPLPFKPKAVLVFPEGGDISTTTTIATYIRGGLAVTGSPAVYKGHTTLALTNSGFTVHSYHVSGDSYLIRLNSNGEKYHYIALG